MSDAQPRYGVNAAGQIVRNATRCNHRSRTDSVYCRYCGAHPMHWGTLDLQVSSDAEAFTALIETARENALDDAHEVTVSVGFMRGIYEQLEAAPTEREMRCFARVLDPDRYPMPGEDFTDIINEALHALRRVMPFLDASSPAKRPS